VAFPSLGLETPVLFINNAKFGLERLEGISRLVHETTLDEYMNDYDIFDVENPPQNPREYLKIRKDLIAKTKRFTGHINEDTLSYSTEKQLFENMLLVSRTCKDTRRYMERARKVSKSKSEKIRDLEKTIQLQEKRINELESDTSRNPLKLFKKR
jgi:hypothetical protein